MSITLDLGSGPAQTFRDVDEAMGEAQRLYGKGNLSRDEMRKQRLELGRFLLALRPHVADKQWYFTLNAYSIHIKTAERAMNLALGKKPAPSTRTLGVAPDKLSGGNPQVKFDPYDRAALGVDEDELEDGDEEGNRTDGTAGGLNASSQGPEPFSFQPAAGADNAPASGFSARADQDTGSDAGGLPVARAEVGRGRRPEVGGQALLTDLFAEAGRRCSAVGLELAAGNARLADMVAARDALTAAIDAATAREAA